MYHSKEFSILTQREHGVDGFVFRDTRTAAVIILGMHGIARVLFHMRRR